MTLKFFSNLRNFDWILFGAVVLLLCFGLSALYSIAISSDQPDFSNFRKQIIFALIGLLLLFLLTFLDYRIWQNYSYFLYGGVGNNPKIAYWMERRNWKPWTAPGGRIEWNQMVLSPDVALRFRIRTKTERVSVNN